MEIAKTRTVRLAMFTIAAAFASMALAPAPAQAGCYNPGTVLPHRLPGQLKGVCPFKTRAVTLSRTVVKCYRPCAFNTVWNGAIRQCCTRTPTVSVPRGGYQVKRPRGTLRLPPPR